MEFSRREYWSGLPFPPPQDLPYPRTEPAFLASSALADMFGNKQTAVPCGEGKREEAGVLPVKKKLEKGSTSAD